MNADQLNERQCSARSKRSGERCKRWAIVGGRVCSFHGGKSPQAKAAAASRRVEANAAAAVRDLGGTPVGNSLELLRQVAGEIVALKDLLKGEVERLGNLETASASQGEQVRAVLSAYERALDRTERVAVSLARTGVEERLTLAAEANGPLLLAWLQWLTVAAVESSRLSGGLDGSHGLIRVVLDGLGRGQLPVGGDAT